MEKKRVWLGFTFEEWFSIFTGATWGFFFLGIAFSMMYEKIAFATFFELSATFCTLGACGAGCLVLFYLYEIRQRRLKNGS